MRLGEYLKERREERGLSQRGLALKMGVSNSTISQIESGRNNPSVELLLSYSKEFNIDIVELYEWMNDEIEEDRLGSLPNINDNSELKNRTWVDIKEIINIPLLGVVRGGQPMLADQNIEGYITVDRNSICPSKEYYALKVKGDSMDKLFPDGTTLVVEKTEFIENNQIAVVGINGNEATVKRVTLADENIALIPQSNNPAYTTTVYNIEKDEIHIMGRVVQAITYF